MIFFFIIWCIIYRTIWNGGFCSIDFFPVRALTKTISNMLVLKYWTVEQINRSILFGNHKWWQKLCLADLLRLRHSLVYIVSFRLAKATQWNTSIQLPLPKKKNAKGHVPNTCVLIISSPAYTVFLVFILKSIVHLSEIYGLTNHFKGVTLIFIFWYLTRILIVQHCSSVCSGDMSRARGSGLP